MKTVLTLIILAAMFVFIADTSIQFSPFKISFKQLPIAVGTLFLMMAILCFLYQGQQNGFKAGVEATINEFKEQSNERSK